MIGANNELVFSVIRCMPRKFRERIVEEIGAAYPQDWKYTKRGEVREGGFYADHFCVWNRYCESVSCFPLVNFYSSYLAF